MGTGVSSPACNADEIVERSNFANDVITRYLGMQIVQPLNTAYSSLQIIQDGLDEAVANRRNIKLQLNASDDLQNEAGLARLTIDSKAACLDAMNIIESVTLYDRLVRGLILLSPKLFFIKQAISECIVLNEKQTEALGVMVMSNFDMKTDIVLKADRHHLLRMLGSLIRGGAKVTDYGDYIEVKYQLISSMDVPWEDISSEVDVPKDDKEYPFMRISVTDRGQGRTPAQIEALGHHFVEFVPPERQDGQGYSLEIWLANKFAKMHGGKLSIYSAGHGKGSTFYFDLPVLCEIPYAVKDEPSEVSLPSP